MYYKINLFCFNKYLFVTPIPIYYYFNLIGFWRLEPYLTRNRIYAQCVNACDRIYDLSNAVAAVAFFQHIIWIQYTEKRVEPRQNIETDSNFELLWYYVLTSMAYGDTVATAALHVTGSIPARKEYCRPRNIGVVLISYDRTMTRCVVLVVPRKWSYDDWTGVS